MPLVFSKKIQTVFELNLMVWSLTRSLLGVI